MMGNSDKKIRSAKIETLIGENTEFVGDVHFKGGLHLDGVIKGNVIADDNSPSIAIIGERGRIEGEVWVPRLLLNGKVVGDVHASDRVELHKHACVIGNVYYSMLEMAMGAQINGNLVHCKPGEKRLLEDKSKKNEGANRKKPMPKESLFKDPPPPEPRGG